ncbi:PIG-L family deacetylase [Glutamicibacter sp. MNS18]|uniref:PIG-L deacetylase family protein n=1 Tax=Glutamicibacter sp. MNS18 TaxID=2989817 RepID=UPI002235A62C|nr:PIG-L family deacetylase [Glutamicibacter sp. MNS18]MCW4465120.1 PIG-L family deacetylase [Glutamicibacter sp. MNS18]
MGLELLDEDWDRALVLMAHPDDPEYGTALAVNRWTSQGKEVSYVLATSGEAGIEGLAPDESGPLREVEQQRAVGHVGVKNLEFLGLPDGRIEYGLPLRREFARVIRTYRPQVVITLNFDRAFGGVYRNSADHQAVGRAVLDAVSDAANSWIFDDLSESVWSGVELIAVFADENPTHYVPVDTDDIAAATSALSEHREYLTRLSPVPIAEQARNQVESVINHDDQSTGPRVAFRVYR